jgi:hypothetical protein
LKECLPIVKQWKWCGFSAARSCLRRCKGGSGGLVKSCACVLEHHRPPATVGLIATNTGLFVTRQTIRQHRALGIA